jgi:hypothetical protein
MSGFGKRLESSKLDVRLSNQRLDGHSLENERNVGDKTAK